MSTDKLAQAIKDQIGLNVQLAGGLVQAFNADGTVLVTMRGADISIDALSSYQGQVGDDVLILVYGSTMVILDSVNSPVRPKREKFLASGTWFMDANANYIVVEVVGGGGAGGSTITNTSGNHSCGAGGGGGAYMRTTYLPTDLPTQVAFTVGAGGFAVSGAAGTNGGATTFMGMTAGGGIGGGVRLNETSTVAVPGGAGGSITGTSDVAATGGSGQMGIGSAGLATSGAGGTSMFGGGGAGVFSASANTSGAGNTGGSFGGGGSGAFTNGTGSGQLGGNAGSGAVFITTYY